MKKVTVLYCSSCKPSMKIPIWGNCLDPKLAHLEVVLDEEGDDVDVVTYFNVSVESYDAARCENTVVILVSMVFSISSRCFALHLTRKWCTVRVLIISILALRWITGYLTEY